MSLDESYLFFGRSKSVTLVPSAAPATLQEGSGYEIRDSFQEPRFSLPWSRPGSLQSSIGVADVESIVNFPQVPATVPLLTLDATLPADTKLPSPLRQPLQKATSAQLNDERAVQVYTSGVRSAIYADGGALYRLKGCGNGVSNSEIHHPFPVRYLSSNTIRDPLNPETPLTTEEMQKDIEIRGAMFDFTARREQAITSLINTSIQQKGIPVANIPLGYYRYNDLSVKTAEGKDEIVSLCCGLYKTHGDKRLASHLIWGLELLLPLVFQELLPPSATPVKTEETTPEADSEEVPPPPLTWCYMRFDGNRITGDEVLETGFAALEGSESLLDLLQLPISPSALKDVSTAPPIPEYADHAAWNEYWTDCWRELLPHSSKLGDAFAAIYWSIGRQSGSIVRAIHDSNVNWGTYDDLLGNHCNSHPNNLVVLQRPSNSYFLAPLDFDLAFTRNSYQPTKASSHEEAEPLWNELREMECNAMNLALGGLNLNSGVEGRADLPALIEPIRIALRDTMVKASYGAYRLEEDGHADASKALEHLFQPLIRLALILSENITA